MIDNRIAEDIQLKLRADHFYEAVHGRIYDAILLLLDRNMVANPVTLKPMFEADEAMKSLGGPAYLAQLTGNGAALIGARDFASFGAGPGHVSGRPEHLSAHDRVGCRR